MKAMKLSSFLVTVLALSFAYSPKIFAGQELKGRKALLIIAPLNFRDEEYSDTKQELEKAGMKVVTASTTTKTATGMLGMRTKPDITISNIKVDDYDIIALPGGSGVKVFYKNQKVISILKQAYKDGKVIGAICLAPVVLAKAGLLKGKKATSWRGAKQTLRDMGVMVLKRPVVTDGRIVTGNGPWVARQFGKRLVKVLKKTLKTGGKR